MSTEFDLVISSASWERRCLAVLEYLGGRRVRRSFVFRYRHHASAAGAAEEQLNYLRLGEKLSQLAEEMITVECDLWEPLNALNKIVGPGRDRSAVEGKRILIDVSTLSKAFVLVLLRYFDGICRDNKVTLFFADMAQPQKGSPSVGVREVLSLPMFGQEFKPGLETALMLFLGFEPERVIGTWETLEPQLTVPFYSLRRDGRDPLKSGILRKYFLNRPGVESPIKVDGRDPMAIAAAMAQVYVDLRDNHNVCIGAVGNKLQCVGSYIFMKLLKADLPVFYPVPSYYRRSYWNPESIGGTMQIELSNGVRIGGSVAA